MLRRTIWRPILTVSVLAATLIAFGHYWITQPALRHELTQLSWRLLAPLLLLYIVFTGALAFINYAALILCRTRLNAAESLLVTMYSSVINFFGPLQSGPAFRAVYMKQRHGVKLRDYTAASFVYYGFYGLFSLIFMFSGLLKWWLLPLCLLLVSSFLYARRFKPRILQPFTRLAPAGWSLMATASLLQVCLLAVIFFIEVRSVSPGVHFSQTLIYTGVANLATFVSLTPGAIGFRESFLLFSQNLHGIGSTTIVAANLIDRCVYILLLALSAAGILVTHANRRLRLKPETAEQLKNDL